MAIDVRERLMQKRKENQQQGKINVAERVAALQAQKQEKTVPIKFTDGKVRNVPLSAFEKIRKETANPSHQKVMRDFAFAKDFTENFGARAAASSMPEVSERDRRDAAVRSNYAERVQAEQDARYAGYDIKGAVARLNNPGYWMQKIRESRSAGNGFEGDKVIAAERDALEKEITEARAAQERNRVRSFARIPQNNDFAELSEGGFYGSYDPRMANPAKYGEMTDEEVKVWRYLANKGRKTPYTSATPGGGGVENGRLVAEFPARDVQGLSAEEYLQSLEDKFVQRRGVKMGVAARTIDNPIGRGAAALGIAALTGIGSSIEGTVSALTGEETKPGTLDYAAGYVRNDIDGALGVAYDLTQSTANMVPSILLGSLSGVPVLGTASMGVSAAGNAYSDALRDGYSKEQARLYGGIVGASEAALQNILGGISALGGKRSATSVLKKLVEKIPKAGLRAAVKLAGSGFSEATEEGLQTYIEAGLRKVIFDENFNLRDVSEDALYSAMLGALSAGLLEGPGVVVSEMENGAASRMQNAKGKVQNIPKGDPSAKPQDDAGIDAPVAGTQRNDTETVQDDGGNVIQYTAEEADGIRKDSQTFRNVIEGIDITLSEFFSKWKAGRKNGEKLEKLYLGKASESVKKKISDLLGYEIPNRDFIITNDAVKHVFNRHGENSEVNFEQVEVDENTIWDLRETITSPDEITKERRKGTDRLIFKKQTGNGDVTVVEVDNKGRATLAVKTMYIKKSTGNTSAKVPVENTTAPSWTSETTEPNPVDNETIPQTPEKSNRQNMPKGDTAAETQRDEDVVLTRGRSFGKPQDDTEAARNDVGADAPAEEAQREIESEIRGNSEEGIVKNSAERAGEVVRDDNYKRAKLTSREGRVLDALARITGVRIRFVEKINGGKDNAQYSNGEIRIALDSEDPVRVAVVHEVIHRLKEISPESYRKLSDFVFNNLTEDELELLRKDFGSGYKELSPDGVSEEIVAQAFGVIMGDKGRLDALIENDRGTWEKICDIINDLIISIRRALSGERAAQISENDRAAFSGLLKKAEEMEKVLREALDASQLKVENGKLKVEAQNDAGAEKNTAGAVKHSIKRDLRSKLQEIFLRKENDGNEVLIGTTSDFLVNELGADPLQVTMPKNKAYAAMATEEEARSSGRYDSRLNYHGLGADLLYEALEASENPVVAFVAEPEGDKKTGKLEDRSDRIVLVTDKKKDGNNIVVIMQVETSGRYAGKQISVNKEITVYDRDSISSDISKAIAYDRLLHFDKKRSQTISAGRPASNSPVTIQKVDFKDNIARFWANVKWKKEGSLAQLEAPGTETGTAMEEAFNKAFEESETKSSRKRNEEERGRIYELERENKKQKKLIEQLKDRMKGMDKTIIRGTVDAKAVRKATRELIRRYGGEINPRELAPELQELWDGIGTGKNLNWEDIHAKTRDIARRIAESSIERDDTMYREFAELRKFCRENTFTISESDRSGIPDFKDFRKRNMGRMRIAYGKTDIDRYYIHLAEMFPGMFDQEVISHPADQLLHIAEVLNDVYEITERGRFDSHMDYAVGTIANDILETFYELPETKKTLKDLKIEKLTRTVIERDIQIKDVEKVLSEYHKHAEKVLSEYNKKEHELETDKEKFRENKEKFYEKQKERQKRAQIIRSVNRLSQRLRWATDNKHIPHELQGAVAKFLECVNLTGLYTYDEKGKLRKNPDGTPTQKSLTYRELRAIYQKFDGELVFPQEFFEGVWEDGKERGDILARIYDLRDTRVAEMTTEQLDVIIKGLKIVETAVKSADTMFSNSRFGEISALAENIRENAPMKDRFKVRKVTASLKQFFDTNNLTPEAFFHRLGEGGDEIFRMLSDAEGRRTQITKKVKAFTEKLLKGESRRKLEREVKKVTLGGEEIEMSVAQIMELYALSRREQAEKHLLQGGMTIVGIPGRKGEKLRDPIKVTLEEIGHAIDLLTTEQKKIAEYLSHFASEKLGGYMNEACRKVFGYEKFGERNYWPIKIDPRTIHQTPDTADAKNATPTIRNFGMAKATTHGANNALMIRSIFDTFADHTAEAATYAAYLEVTEDMRRIINFTFRDGDTGMRNVLDGVFGITETKDGEGRPIDKHPGIEYWNKLYEDINGGMSAKDGGSPFDRFFRNAKLTSVAANLRVVIQQPTAYIRAGDEIGYTYLSAGTTHAVRGWKRALKYAPIAQQKDWGRADIGTGHTMKELLFGSDGTISKIQEWSMGFASVADAFAWGSLWTACEMEVRAKNKGLKDGTDAFYNAVAQRFTEIVNKTQVVDGVLQRSQNMRNQNALVKMGTMFMSEPTKQYNMLATAVYDLRHAETKEERAKARRKLARTGISLTLSGVLNAAAQSIIDALRDDEKEKTYWEKWFSAFLGLPEEGEDSALQKFQAIVGGNLASAANPFGYFPFAKDIWSLLQGYEVKRTDVEGIADFLKAAKGVLSSITGEGVKTRKAALNELLATGATLYGIPYASFKRDIGAIAKSVIQGTGNPVLEYRIEKLSRNIKHERNAEFFYDILFSAKEKDKEAYDIIYADMVKSGMAKEDIDKKISTHTSGKFDSALSAAKKAKDKKDATLTDKIVYRHLNREKNMTRDVRAGDEETVLRNLDKYRESVEKYLKKYPGEDEEKKLEYAYREACRELYGEKYAIRASGGADVYKKAQEKVTGTKTTTSKKTTWKEYYDKYFGKAERRYKAVNKRVQMTYSRFEKIADIMSKQENKEEKIAEIVKLGYKESEASGIYAAYNEAK